MAMTAPVEAILTNRWQPTQDGTLLAVCAIGRDRYAVTLPPNSPVAEGKRIRVVVERPGRAVLA